MDVINFPGILAAVALGVLLFKSIFFVIEMINLKTTNSIIEHNLAYVKAANQKTQLAQSTVSSLDNVLNWRVEDPRLTEDLRQQFLIRTRTRRATPTSGQISPAGARVPLATTDFNEPFDEVSEEEEVPIYTYNESIGGTQV